MNEPTYKVYRFYERHGRRLVKRGLTLEEAQALCSGPEASSQTAKSRTNKARTRKMGPWFCGYHRERGAGGARARQR